jgi:predicted membrane chloride channel (bestrophin family)
MPVQHKTQTLVLYFLALPLQLLNDLGWFVIPGTAIVCFIYYGIEFIGAEIGLFRAHVQCNDIELQCQSIVR